MMIRILLLSVLLSGCASLPDPELYLLSPLSGQKKQTPQSFIVALKPVELPKYLKGLKIVLRKNENQLELVKKQRWAEPLADNFTRVLASNLAQRLGLKQVYLYPQQAPKKVDIIVNVVVNHFLSSPQDGVDLEAHWQLLTPRERKIIFSDTLRHHQALPYTPANTFTLVNTMSQNIARLADQIAEQIAQEKR